jgi:hypothetical protein
MLVATALTAVMVDAAAQAADTKASNEKSSWVCKNNSCKGKSACKGFGNDSCKGQNACKGHGMAAADNAKDCKKAGGVWTKAEAG